MSFFCLATFDSASVAASGGTREEAGVDGVDGRDEDAWDGALVVEVVFRSWMVF